jgi:hypothetical protein
MVRQAAFVLAFLLALWLVAEFHDWLYLHAAADLACLRAAAAGDQPLAVCF